MLKMSLANWSRVNCKRVNGRSWQEPIVVLQKRKPFAQKTISRDKRIW